MHKISFNAFHLNTFTMHRTAFAVRIIFLILQFILHIYIRNIIARPSQTTSPGFVISSSPTNDVRKGGS